MNVCRCVFENVAPPTTPNVSTLSKGLKFVSLIFSKVFFTLISSLSELDNTTYVDEAGVIP
jgi:hypothetical protein